MVRGTVYFAFINQVTVVEGLPEKHVRSITTAYGVTELYGLRIDDTSTSLKRKLV